MPESGPSAPDWPDQPADGAPAEAVAAGGTDQFGWPAADDDTAEPEWPAADSSSPDGVKVAKDEPTSAEQPSEPVAESSEAAAAAAEPAASAPSAPSADEATTPATPEPAKPVEQPSAPKTAAEEPVDQPSESAEQPSKPAASAPEPVKSEAQDSPPAEPKPVEPAKPEPAAKAEASEPAEPSSPAGKETAPATQPGKPAEPAKPEPPAKPAEPPTAKTDGPATQSDKPAEPAKSVEPAVVKAEEPAAQPESPKPTKPVEPAAKETAKPTTPPEPLTPVKPAEPLVRPTAKPAVSLFEPATPVEPSTPAKPAEPSTPTKPVVAQTGKPAASPAPPTTPPASSTPVKPAEPVTAPTAKPAASLFEPVKPVEPATPAKPVATESAKPVVPPTAKLATPTAPQPTKPMESSTPAKPAEPVTAPVTQPTRPTPPPKPAEPPTAKLAVPPVQPPQPPKPTVRPAEATTALPVRPPVVPPKPAGQPPRPPAPPTTQFPKPPAPQPPPPARPKEPDTLRIRLADVPVKIGPVPPVSPLEDTVAMPVDNDRARLDPPTVQLPNPAEALAGDDSPTVRVRLPRPPAAGRPELGDDVPQPAPQLPPPPRASEENEPVAARRSRKPALVGLALVLVLALGVGIWFGAPGVVQALGLSGPSVTPTSPPPSPSVPDLLIKPLSNPPTPTSAGLAAALAGPASAPALGTLTGSIVDPATGTSLWDHSSTTPLTPASSGKLLTMTAALLSLDPQFRFTTKVVAGPEPGSVILVGGGDPTLSSLPAGKESVYPGAAHLDDLVAQVKKAVGGPVTKVLLDTSRYSGDLMAPGWENSDIAGGSVAPITPIMLDGGRSKPTASDPARTASPDMDAAKEFARRLGADPNTVDKQTAPADAKVLGSVQSPPLTDMVSTLLQISDNVLAEAIGREVAKQAGAPVTFAGGASSVLNILRNNNFDLTGVTMSDGSGLSTQDRVTARLLGSIMTVAAGPDGGDDPRVAKLRPLLNGLPVAGGSGTLSDRYKDAASSAGKGYVRAKTGTLDGVNTLAGIVQDTDGKVLAFALMSNGSQIDQGRAALDAVAAALRGCGCR
ncbi:D-alanyl-D-alanine carboxypeptidase/D-alanyl-D-alanine endopeptidase [Kutzneria sp. CA-103260]|uniref:D-alanyl-D-alanine carboxypeptidase/D-alanyl-D-alanine endopeptidase n=1 Tax=Kutzneria sp. CA-103260 TaxID=2802641 RepID=UPI001BA7A577|nr:D-alanyl-D-alanine carboxypeptidase/D-alanyl-D-alanine-endopeptidase [Kutzneria sp. CA-103260]QUQ69678.1 D-Ala-D-Ala carboxypeptidase 3 (S13) family protein [Kutzneria sp. CA-103260]